MTYTNCRHRIWICNPSSASAVATAVIIAAVANILRVGLVAGTVTVSVCLLSNFCICISCIGVIIRIETDSKTGIKQPVFIFSWSYKN
jgi:hypothetical protein